MPWCKHFRYGLRNKSTVMGWAIQHPSHCVRQRREETQKKSQAQSQQKTLRDRCTRCCLTVQQQNKVSCKATPGEPKHSSLKGRSKNLSPVEPSYHYRHRAHSTCHDHHKERGICPVLGWFLSCPISGSDKSCDRAVSWLTVESFCMSCSISWMCQSY